MIFLLAAFLYNLYISSNSLMVSHYTISSDKVTAPFRVVQLADLHSHIFGKKNSRLIDKVGQQKPDLILITGDLLDADMQDCTSVCDLLETLTELCPVYVSLGNQDLEYGERYHVDVEELFARTGVTVLEFSMINITVKGNPVRLGGLYGYCSNANGENNPAETAYLTNLQDTDFLTILICHLPLCWYEGISLWDIDCVFCGHVHGGQVQIPGIGGLYAPDEGFFPGRLCGIYESDDGGRQMILSRGLGSAREQLPRFNNIPEIVTVDFSGK